MQFVNSSFDDIVMREQINFLERMKTWIVRPSTTKMLAALYGISRGVMTNQINALEEKLGPRIGNFWTVKQILIILDKLGPPPQSEIVYPSERK